MDLQTRKLNLISYLIKLDNEKMFDKIESVAFSGKQLKKEVEIFSQEELIERAKKADSDYINKKYRSVEALEDESDNW